MNNKEKVESSLANDDEVNEYIDNTIQTFSEKLEKSVSFLGSKNHDKLVIGLINELKKYTKNAPLFIECTKDWYEDPQSKTGWSDDDWVCTDESLHGFENFYEVHAVTDWDKHYHPIHSVWKLKAEI